MDSRSKASLMKKYWQGETSVQEDAQLVDLFATQPNLFSEEEKRYFGSIKDLQKLKLPEDFGKTVIAKMPSEDAVVSTRRLPAYVMQIAAALVLLIGVAWGYTQYKQASTTQKFADATTQQAYEEAQQALLIISQKMSKVKSVTAAFGKFESAQERIKLTTQK